jgi:DNA-binding CsgD family transcriptional regulator
MFRDLSKIKEIYSEIFDSYGSGILREHIKKMLDFDHILPYDSTFFCVTNTQELTFEYVSKNVISCLGITPKELKEGGMKAFWSRMCPEDVDPWLKALSERMVYTMGNLSPEDRQRMSYTWNYRLKNAEGVYINIIQNTTPLIFNSEGKPVVGLAHYTILHENLVLPITATAKYLNSNNTYETKFFSNYSQKLLSDEITGRERDVIRLLVMNLSSKEIGEKLHISSSTVDTHRRNILKKLKLGSTGELVGLLKARPELL